MKTIQEQLIEKGFSDKAELKEKDKRQFQKFKESLTDIDWADLMGSNKQTYRRAKGGAIRRNRYEGMRMKIWADEMILQYKKHLGKLKRKAAKLDKKKPLHKLDLTQYNSMIEEMEFVLK